MSQSHLPVDSLTLPMHLAILHLYLLMSRLIRELPSLGLEQGLESVWRLPLIQFFRCPDGLCQAVPMFQLSTGTLLISVKTPSKHQLSCSARPARCVKRK